MPRRRLPVASVGNPILSRSADSRHTGAYLYAIEALIDMTAEALKRLALDVEQRLGADIGRTGVRVELTDDEQPQSRDRVRERVVARGCAWCGSRIKLRPRAGHQRYCGRSCRQRAYEGSQ